MEEGAPGWVGLSPDRGSVWGPRGAIWVPREAGFSEGQPGGADAACCEEEPGRSICLCVFLCTHTCFTKDSQTPKCQTQFSRQVTARRESDVAMRAWYSWPSGEGLSLSGGDVMASSSHCPPRRRQAAGPPRPPQTRSSTAVSHRNVTSATNSDTCN